MWCEKVNECKANKSFCNGNGACDVNNNGSAYCTCHAGFTGTNCETDIDECSGPVTPCDDVTSTCVNTNGSYQCVCNEGYKG